MTEIWCVEDDESIREIERAVDEVRAELGKVLAQKHLAAKKMAD